ncbi:MAG: ATPase [Candidatus Aenigmarchaeota archaeon]|nr:ATPase [Candidatus Aenigmarchaeota archaeon]
MPLLQRVKTGIPGLDSLIEGGLVENSVILVSGGTGCGKTILASQFIYHGLERGDPGLYITLEETPEDIRADSLQFGWDFQKYEKKGLCKIIYHDPAQINNIGTVILDELSRSRAKRLAIDSTSVMTLAMENPAQIRKKLYGIISTIKRAGHTTALLMADIPEGSKGLSMFGVEEFVADAVIVLSYLGVEGSTSRSLQIRKMRRTDHGKDVYPMVISKKGIAIRQSEI